MTYFGRVLIASYMRWCPPGESAHVHGPRHAVARAAHGSTRGDSDALAASRIDPRVRSINSRPRLLTPSCRVNSGVSIRRSGTETVETKRGTETDLIA